eukprot:Nk52_evm33s1524 gene=Nk52_evmTU33s1524
MGFFGSGSEDAPGKASSSIDRNPVERISVEQFYPDGNGKILYEIKVTTKMHQWVISKRYSDIHRLHTYDLGGQFAAFPPKLYFGRESKEFLLQRQEGLQGFFNWVHSLYLDDNNHDEKAVTVRRFLLFGVYEPVTVRDELQLTVERDGDKILESQCCFPMSVSSLHSLGLAVDTFGMNAQLNDFLKSLTNVELFDHVGSIVEGARDCGVLLGPRQDATRHGALSSPKCSLRFFKNIRKLKVRGLNVLQISHWDCVSKSLEVLRLRGGAITFLSDLKRSVWECFLSERANSKETCETEERAVDHGFYWSRVFPNLGLLDVSKCDLITFDAGQLDGLLIRELDLSFNRLSIIPKALSGFKSLHRVNLSHNEISNLIECNHCFRSGNLKELDLSCNKITSLRGLEQIGWNLVSLNLCNNLLTGSRCLNVFETGFFPNLINLWLKGNSIHIVKDGKTLGDSQPLLERYVRSLFRQGPDLVIDDHRLTMQQKAEFTGQHQAVTPHASPSSSPSLFSTTKSSPSRKQSKQRLYLSERGLFQIQEQEESKQTLKSKPIHMENEEEEDSLISSPLITYKEKKDQEKDQSKIPSNCGNSLSKMLKNDFPALASLQPTETKDSGGEGASKGRNKQLAATATRRARGRRKELPTIVIQSVLMVPTPRGEMALPEEVTMKEEFLVGSWR